MEARAGGGSENMAAPGACAARPARVGEGSRGAGPKNVRPPVGGRYRRARSSPRSLFSEVRFASHHAPRNCLQWNCKFFASEGRNPARIGEPQGQTQRRPRLPQPRDFPPPPITTPAPARAPPSGTQRTPVSLQRSPPPRRLRAATVATPNFAAGLRGAWRALLFLLFWMNPNPLPTSIQACFPPAQVAHSPWRSSGGKIRNIKTKYPGAGNRKNELAAQPFKQFFFFHSSPSTHTHRGFFLGGVEVEIRGFLGFFFLASQLQWARALRRR